jgi:hypothetical protein
MKVAAVTREDIDETVRTLHCVWPQGRDADLPSGAVGGGGVLARLLPALCGCFTYQSDLGRVFRDSGSGRIVKFDVDSLPAHGIAAA